MNASLESALSFVLNGLWRASWQASILAIVVLILQKILGKRLGGRGRFALWAIVLMRLLIPVLPESRFSVFNLMHRSKQPVAAPVAVEPEHEIPIIVIGPHSAKPQAAVEVPVFQKHTIRWSTWIFAAWFAGVLTLALRVAQICWELSLTVRSLAVVTDPDLLRVVESCAKTLHLRRIPRVLAGDTVQTPAVVGLFRPKLLMPSHVLASCDSREIRLIVLHELAHLKRHDIAGNWLIALASILHWFNPFVWILAARMRADRELACDELVLAHSTGDAHAYGQTLVKLIEILSPRIRSFNLAPKHLAIVGILESTTPMQRRVRMIAQFNPKQSRRWIWTIVVLGLLGSVALTDAVRGENDPPAKSPATHPAAAEEAELVTRGYDVTMIAGTPQTNTPNQYDQVIKAIETFVDPNTWVDTGGELGRIQEVNGKLLIQQTAAAHEKIAELLKLLTPEPPPTAPAMPQRGGPGMYIGGEGGGVAPAQPPAPRTVVSDEQIEQANRAAMAILQKVVPEVKFDNTALSDVIDFFRDITNSNIVVNWRALEEAGVDKSDQVSLRLKDTRFETALSATLRQVGASRAALVIDRGVLTITTQADLMSYLLTKTYEVRDLVGDQAEGMQSLVSVMQSLTQEGGVGVQAFGTKMIITALPSAHEQVDKLLADLRNNPSKAATRPALGMPRPPRPGGY